LRIRIKNSKLSPSPALSSGEGGGEMRDERMRED